MNSLDLLLLGLLGVSALIGYNRGLLSVLGGLGSSLVALAAAIIYRDDLAIYLEKEFGLQTMLVQVMVEKMPQPVLGKFLPALHTLPFIKNELTGLAYMILSIVAFLLLYLIVSKGLLLITGFLENSLRRGAWGGANRLAGMVITAAKDLLIMAVLLGIIYPFIHRGAALGFKGLMKAGAVIDQSWLVPYLNIIFISLEKLIGIGA